MNENQDYLNKVRIATPCSADWDKMSGDERVRHCQQCNLNVYNIAEMTEVEAVNLLQQSTGRVCIQIYRRKDGTVITKDCPKGLERVRRTYRKCAMVASSLVAWLGFAAPGYTQSGGEVMIPQADAKSNSTEIKYVTGAPRPLRGKVAPRHSSNTKPDMGNMLPPIKGEAELSGTMGDVALPPLQKGNVKVVDKVDLKAKTPIKCTITPQTSVRYTPLKSKQNNSNKLLASGLAIMLLAAVSKFVFGNMKRRSSIWIVGSSFACAFIAIGIIWQFCW